MREGVWEGVVGCVGGCGWVCEREGVWEGLLGYVCERVCARG